MKTQHKTENIKFQNNTAVIGGFLNSNTMPIHILLIALDMNKSYRSFRLDTSALMKVVT